MKGDDTFVLLLTGSPGSGKSEALTRVHDDLADRGVDSAAIDVDELARSYPPLESDRHLSHLAALSASFRDAGRRLLLVAATAENEENLRGWLRAAGGDRQLVVHLTAPAATLEERVRGREPTDWSGLPGLVESAKRLSSIRFEAADLELDTDQRTVADIAASIEAELRMHTGCSALDEKRNSRFSSKAKQPRNEGVGGEVGRSSTRPEAARSEARSALVTVLAVLLFGLAAVALVFAWAAVRNIGPGGGDSADSAYIEIGAIEVGVALLCAFGGFAALRHR